MTQDLLEELTNNVALLLALIFVYGALIPSVRRGEVLPRIALGLLFGGTAVFGMLYPYALEPGLIFDGRSVVLSLAGYFGGPLVALTAAAVAALYRAWIGGVGLITGIGVIVTSAVIGVVAHELRRSGRLRNHPATLLALGLFVHAAALVWMLALPAHLEAAVISEIAGPYLGVLTLTTWLVGAMFQLVEQREAALQDALEAKMRFDNLVEGSRVGVFMVQDGRLAYVNQALGAMLGERADRIIGQPVDALVAPPLRSGFRERFAAMERAEVAMDRSVVQAQRVDGQTIATELYASGVRHARRPAVVGMLIDVSERERAAAQVAQSERLLRDSQRAARIGSYEFDVGTQRWTTSATLDDIFGLDADHPRTTEAWMGLVAADQREALLAYFYQVLESGERFDREYAVVRASDAARCWVHGLGTVERDAQGRPMRLVGTIQDITQRKAAERAAAASEQRFRSLVDAIPDLVWLKDPDGVYLACNPTFERFVGAREADVIGKTDYDFVDRELAEFFRRKDREALAAGGPLVNEETLTMADDGRVIEAETIKTPLFDHEGLLVGVLGVSRDITARKQAKRALLQSQMLHEQAQRVAQIGHWALDHASGLLEWSDETYRIFEYEPHSAVSYARVVASIHPEDRQMVEEAFSAAVTAHKPYALVHRVLIDGRVKYVEERAETQYGDDGRPWRSVGTVQDVTQRRLIELELAREAANTQMMFRTMTDGYIRVDVTGRILDANPAYCRAVGYEHDELVGRSLERLSGAGGSQELRDRLREIIDKGATRFLTQHRRKDGGLVDFDVSVAVMPEAEPQQVAAFLRDVTREKRVEAQYAELVNRIPAGVFRYRTVRGGGGHFEFVSHLFCSLLNVDEQTALSEPGAVFARVRPEDSAAFETLRASARDAAHVFAWDGPLQVDGRTRWVHVEAGATPGAAGELVWHGIVTDVTERQELLERLRLESAAIASTIESIVITDLRSNIVSVNPAFSAISGYRAEEVIGKNISMLQSGRHGESFYREMFRVLGESGYWQGQVWNRRKSGDLYPELLAISVVRDAGGKPTHYVGVSTDITQLKRSEEQLQHLAHHDVLTGLPNRLLVGSRLEHALERARRDAAELVVLYLDLDRFKTVNDSLGHEVGDQLLVAVAHRLKALLREEDTIGRLGGDEFLILLEQGGGVAAAAKVAQKIVVGFSEPFALPSGHDLYIQTSIGISLFPADGGSAEILIRNADSAMFRAKEQGRNSYQFYTEALTQAASDRLDLEQRIRRGIVDDEFKVWYQPIYSFATKRIIGAEALIRWPAADGTMIPPDRFIPIAEDSGLIIELGRQVLEQCSVDVRGWLDRGLPVHTVAVNLSVQQFRERHFERLVAAVIAEAGIPPGILELEITERGLMDLGGETLDKLQALKALGVRLAIDDFGTGYSSLAYLKRMPVDKLKIDRSFVDQLPHDGSDAAIVRTIIAIARTLRLKVLAEGVENADQLGFLRSAGCDECQGFLFGRAMPADRFAEQLAQQPEAR